MKLAVIGGGVSGMIAAVSASIEGADVTLYEHMPRLGRKLLITGSGKCNISNTDMDISHFHSGDIKKVEAVINKYPPKVTLSFLERLGLYLKDKNGYLYPYSEQASAAVDILRFAVRDHQIDVHIEADVRKIEKVGSGNDRNLEGKFVVSTPDRSCTFDKLIICTGSCANRNTGSDGSGYELAKMLGHSVIKPLPGLTSLTCEEEFFPSIAGIRTKACVSLYAGKSKENRELIGTDTGELQIIKTGISGIPVFNLSYLAARALDEKKHVSASLDLLCDISEDDIPAFLKERLKCLSDRSIEELFIGLLAKMLGVCICKRCGLDLKAKCSTVSDQKIAELSRMIKHFEVTVKGHGDFETCQVASGGVPLSEVKDTLESTIVSGLFFAGEILDVNGDCGGYNLQWAQSSAMLAAREAIR